MKTEVEIVSVQNIKPPDQSEATLVHMDQTQCFICFPKLIMLNKRTIKGPVYPNSLSLVVKFITAKNGVDLIVKTLE